MITLPRRLTATVLLFALLITPSYAPLASAQEAGDGAPSSESAEDAGDAGTEEGGAEEDAGEGAPETEAPETPEAAVEEADAERSIDLPEAPAASEEVPDAEEAPLPESETALTDTASTTGAVEGASENADALLAADAPSEATTTASTTPEGPTVVSGRAVAIANILNLVNASFVNSEGAILFGNLVDPYEGTLDFRQARQGGTGSLCGLFACGDELLVRVENDASIDNAVLVEATTGDNEVEGDGGTIRTGDAYAGLNLVNIANANFVDSDYLLVTLNAFDSVAGDIVFPGLADFFSGLAGFGGSSFVSNAAQVENDIEVVADSGGNEAEGGAIETGDASGSTNVFNQINASLAGAGNVSILFRVHGSWAGEIFGAPPGLSWVPTTDGGLFLFDAESGGTGSEAEVHATNTAVIHNDVSVVALTGGNRADGEAALISTGDARASANVINVANTNVVGRNWMLAVINIFGDFTGNIAFGRPDLWVGAQADAPGRIKDGSEVTYKFTVINNGDSPATEVRLVEDYDERFMTVLSSSLAYEAEDGAIAWDIGTLPPGGAVEVTYEARVTDAGEGREIASVVTAAERETDDNEDDNSDAISIRTYEPDRSSKKERKDDEGGGAPARFSIVRETEATALPYGERAARQTVILRNDGGRDVPGIVLHDLLLSPEGKIIADEVFDLGTVLAGEEITIGYDAVFAEDAPPGRYGLATVIETRSGDRVSPENGHIVLLGPIPSPLAIAEPEEDGGEVLGALLEIPVARAAERETPAMPASNPYTLAVLFGLALALLTNGRAYARFFR